MNTSAIAADAPAPRAVIAPARDERRSGGSPARRAAKGLIAAVGLALVALPAATCWVEARLSGRSELFVFWGQALALAPGLPGKYLRRCFYYLTLRRCALSADIGFLSSFSDRRAEVGERVYVGVGVSFGLVSLGDGCLIGNRAAVINGGRQHALGPDGRLTPFDARTAERVRIGSETWIGEGAVLMADVGDCCIVGAGSVVSQPIPGGCLVAGNPARLVRKLLAEPPAVAGAPAPSQEARR